MFSYMSVAGSLPPSALGSAREIYFKRSWSSVDRAFGKGTPTTSTARAKSSAKLRPSDNFAPTTARSRAPGFGPVCEGGLWISAAYSRSTTSTSVSRGSTKIFGMFQHDLGIILFSVTYLLLHANSLPNSTFLPRRNESIQKRVGREEYDHPRRD
jgi:hypothetical protein